MENQKLTPKFKVGDKVRVSETKQIGVVILVQEHNYPWIYYVDWGSGTGLLNAGWFAESEIEKTAATTVKQQGLRLQIAAQALQGMLTNPNIIMSCGCLEDKIENITKHAVMYADALIAECKK